MNVVYLLQSGEDGPVVLGTTTNKGLLKRIKTVQDYNPEAIKMRLLLDGDERLERRLHVMFNDAELHIRGDWYRPAALPLVPAEIPHVRPPRMSDERREAAQRIADRVGRR